MDQDYPLDIEILRYVNSHGQAGPSEIAEALDAERSYVERRLQDLAERGLLEGANTNQYETTNPGEAAIDVRSVQ